MEAAAKAKNPFAAALAAKIYLTEETCKSVPDAIRFFELAAQNGSEYAEYQLGKLYLFGQEVERDLSLALRWLDAAADHGNPYAAQLLNSYRAGHSWRCGLCALQLLQLLASMFEDRENERQNRNLRQARAERKLLRKIEEKRRALGLKHG